MTLSVSKPVLRKAVLSIAAAIAIESSISPAASAQCISGLGATPNDLTNQTWPAFGKGVDFTVSKLVSGANGGGQEQTIAGPFTSIVPFGASGTFILNSADGTILEIGHPGPGTSQRVNGAVGVSSVPPSAGAYGTSLFYAGQTLWVGLSNGKVTNVQSFIYGVDITTPASIDLDGGNAVGATFDGQYVWFSTDSGYLVAVQPPAKKAGTDVAPPPAFVTRREVGVPSGQALGVPIFDGQYIWVPSGSLLLKFDPQQLSVIGAHQMPSAITNVAYDGTFFWIGGTNGNVTKFDPLETKVIADYPFGRGTVYSNGSAITVVSAVGTGFGGPALQTVTQYRACDGAVLHKATLPSAPLQAVYDGERMIFIYPNSNTVSAR